MGYTVTTHQGAEPNRVKWSGARPCADGIFIAASEADVSATTIIYTVPAGYTLHLYNSWVTFRNRASSEELALSVRNAADVFKYHLMGVSVSSGYTDCAQLSKCQFAPTIIPTGYDIYLASSGWGNGGGGIEGYLVAD